MISSIFPTSGGSNGGLLITISGNGFPRTTSGLQVQIGSGTCSVVQTSPSQIQCIVPAQGSGPSSANVAVTVNGLAFPSSASFSYSSGSTPSITSISPTSGVAGQLLTISGSNFVSGQTTVTIGGTSCSNPTVTSSSITCTVGSSPAGNQPVVVNVANVGQSNTNVQFQYALQVSGVNPTGGSFGGGQLVTLVGDGFNASGISVTICGQACQSVSVQSNTQLTCRTPAATVQSSDQSCGLTVTVGSLSQSVSYVYQANLTATITGVNPSRGGTGGGTIVVISGTNFP